MVAAFLLNNIWFVLLLWLAVYAADYSLTIYQVGLLRRGIEGRIGVEGSLELNPVFQKDVDRQRRFSPRWLLLAAVTSGLIFAIWWLFVWSSRIYALFWFFLGMLFLSQAAVQMRHFTNIVTFKQILRGEASGSLVYTRRAALLISSGQFLGYTVLFFLFFLLTLHWFFLGGAFGCASLAMNHFRRARKLPARSAAPPPAPKT